MIARWQKMIGMMTKRSGWVVGNIFVYGWIAAVLAAYYPCSRLCPYADGLLHICYHFLELRKFHSVVRP